MTVAFTDQASWARVISHARCGDRSLDADQWFPVSVETDKARLAAAVFSLGDEEIARARETDGRLSMLGKCNTGRTSPHAPNYVT